MDLLFALLLPMTTILDEEGKLSIADAPFALSFDSLGSTDGFGVTAYDERGNPVDPIGLGTRFTTDDSIEGRGAIRIGGSTSYLTVDVASARQFIGRRVEISFWQKPEGTRVQAQLYWYGGNVLSPDATYLGALILQPTGNVTNDGWEEFTTGPFDFAWAHDAPPITMSFSDEQITALYGGGSYDVDAHVLVDALAVRDLGPAAVPDSTCDLVNERSNCGEEGVCHYGVCVDGAIRFGALLHDEALRADWLDRRAFEVALFEGGRAPLSRAGDVGAALAALKAAPHASTFWPTIVQAYDVLIDGHASSPLTGYPQYLNAGLCVHEGEADLIDGRVAPMVFSRVQNQVGGALELGDVLTAIDGMPVAEWVALAGRLVRHPGDRPWSSASSIQRR